MFNWEEILKGYGRKRNLRKDEILFHFGQKANAFYFLKAGEICLYKLNAAGKEIMLRKVYPGEVFGEVMVFTDSEFPVGALVCKDCEVVEYTKREITTAINNNKEIAMFFIKVLSQRCLLLNEKVYQFSSQDVTTRLASFLWRYLQDNGLCCKAKAGEPVEIFVSKKEIANSIGTASETLSRTFQKLHQMGIAKVFGKMIVILDFNKLEETARE